MAADPGSGRFVVRRGVAADVAAAVELFVVVAAEGRWIGREVVNREERHAELMAALRRSEDTAVFVGEAGGEVVAQLGVTLRPYGVAELGMHVAPAWRGRGVGTALLEAAIAWARDAGAHKLALQVWPHNEPALGLYRKFGFVEEGRLRRHYRRRNGELWDAVVMGLVLDHHSPGAPA
ncbi:MAG TPA: GNAT family N-acetyltransferase [Acidimicrobiales bacterium]|nr:GNAT family N-acetyltransferase [Acidimicrobiales bacterium]